MITIKDLTTLINHLHQANRIFDIEASIEEQKYGKHSEAIVHDLRSRYAPRSAILHNKAELVHSLEKKLLDECDSALVPLKEDTIYKARELIAESAYPWIGRKEPSITFMDDLMSDETFTPFTHHLEDEKKRLLSSSISILNLPEYAHNEIISYFDRTHNKQKIQSGVTVRDLMSLTSTNLTSSINTNKDYILKLIAFRLYILGLRK